MKAPKYKVFYDDNTTFSGEPYDAPAWGVLVIVEEDKEHGRRLIQNADYYCLEDRGDGLCWWESDFVALIDYLSHPGPRKVIFGRLVPNKIHQEIFSRAYNDPDFLPKSGNIPRHHGSTA